MLFQDNFSPTLLLNKQSKQTLSPGGSWHSSVPSFLTPVIHLHPWISFATKKPNSGWPLLFILCATPRSPVTSISFLWSNFSSLTKWILQTICVLLVFTQPPLPHFPLYFPSYIRGKSEASSLCYNPTYFYTYPLLFPLIVLQESLLLL